MNSFLVAWTNSKDRPVNTDCQMQTIGLSNSWKLTDRKKHRGWRGRRNTDREREARRRTEERQDEQPDRQMSWRWQVACLLGYGPTD